MRASFSYLACQITPMGQVSVNSEVSNYWVTQVKWSFSNIINFVSKVNYLSVFALETKHYSFFVHLRNPASEDLQTVELEANQNLVFPIFRFWSLCFHQILLRAKKTNQGPNSPMESTRIRLSIYINTVR